VADVLALNDVNHVFGYVRGVIADALEILGYQNQFEGGEDDAGIAHHVREELAEDLVAVVVHGIIHGQNFLCELDVAADYRVERVSYHFFGDFAHAGEIDVRFDPWVAQNSHRALGDIHGLVTNALEIVIDPGDGQDQPQIDGHQLMKSQELDYAVVDFQLKFVDGIFFVEDALGQLFIAIEDGVNRLMDGALGKTTHPKQALFQFVQVFFEVAFHMFPQFNDNFVGGEGPARLARWPG
jgi:hypothetical protein